MGEYLSDADLMEMVEPILKQVPVGSRWKHRKEGEPYRVEAVGLGEGTLDPVIAYRPEREGSVVWFRVARDFMDGRFTRLVDDP